MSIAAGFDKHRESIGNSIDAVLSKIAQEEAMKQLLNQTSRTDKKIKKNLTSFGDPVKDATWETDQNGMESQVLGDIGTNPGGNYKDAMRNSQQEISKFIQSQLTNKDIPEDKLRLALSGLNNTLGSFKKSEDNFGTFTPGQGIYNKDTGEVVNDGIPKTTQNTKFTGSSEKGYYKDGVDENGNPTREWVANPNYKPDKSGNGAGGKDESKLTDPSKIVGKLKEAITKIKGIKTAKKDPKTGLYKVPDPNNLGFYDASEEELNGLKEQFKTQYVSDANELVDSQGLNDAIVDVRTILDKKGRDIKNLKPAIDDFMKLNPNYDATDRDIIETWFNLFLQ